jgi:hypothetical protein
MGKTFSTGLLTNAISTDSSNRVGIGTTPSFWNSSFKPIQLGSYGGYISGRTNENSMFLGTNHYFDSATSQWIYTTTGAVSQMYFNGADIIFRNNVSGTAGTATGFSERMRITSGGNVLINTTTDGNGSLIIANANNYGLTLRRGNTTDRFYFFVGQGGSYITDDCYINTNNADIHIKAGATGGVKLSVGATSFVSDSDIRLKDKIGNIDNALESILKLETLKFNWKYDSELETKRAYFGLVAQNVQELLPELVEIGKDKMQTLGIKYTELIPVLVKAIQELKAEIDQLKNK